MKSSTYADYSRRIERVVEEIGRLLRTGVVPDVADLANHAALSEFHFQRIFRLMTGEPVGAMIRRLRIAASLSDLRETGSVTRASASAGYATSQAFARAFRSQSGMAPSEMLRIEDRDGPHGIEKSFCLDQEAPAISVEIMQLDPFTIAAIRKVGDPSELDVTYAALFEKILSVHAPTDIEGIYGIPYDDPRFDDPSGCRFDCGLAVRGIDVASLGLAKVELGACFCAVTLHTGSYDGIPATMDRLLLRALELDRMPADRPIFVEYVDEPESCPDDQLRSAIYLPICE